MADLSSFVSGREGPDKNIVFNGVTLASIKDVHVQSKAAGD